MKTLLSFLRRIGDWAGVILPNIHWVVVALIPTILYGAVWWLIPQTPWWILSTIVGGVIWVSLQILWPLFLVAWGIGWAGLSLDHDEH